MSKIPEGATHTAPDKTYRKMAGKHWLTYADGDWIFVEGAAPQHYTPIQAELECSFEGLLPAIGVIVFVHDPDGVLRYGQNESGEVIAHIENTAVVRMSYGLGCFEARVLRTQEQIEAKERNRVCDRIYGIITGPGVERKDNRSDMAEALYDAGLRFVEVTK